MSDANLLELNKKEVTEDVEEITSSVDNKEIINEPVKDVEDTVTNDTVDDIVDIDVDLSATRKKRLRINGDNSKIIELNLSDMNIGKRLDVEYKKLRKYMDSVKDIAVNPDNDEDSLRLSYERFEEIDKKMRECVDNIFDYPVSEVCAPTGSMYDMFSGAFRFEHIIDTLTKLYENNLNTEYHKMLNRVNSTAAKYTKGRK